MYVVRSLKLDETNGTAFQERDKYPWNKPTNLGGTQL